MMEMIQNIDPAILFAGLILGIVDNCIVILTYLFITRKKRKRLNNAIRWIEVVSKQNVEGRVDRSNKDFYNGYQCGRVDLANKVLGIANGTTEDS